MNFSTLYTGITMDKSFSIFVLFCLLSVAGHISNNNLVLVHFRNINNHVLVQKGKNRHLPIDITSVLWKSNPVRDIRQVRWINSARSLPNSYLCPISFIPGTIKRKKLCPTTHHSPVSDGTAAGSKPTLWLLVVFVLMSYCFIFVCIQKKR